MSQLSPTHQGVTDTCRKFAREQLAPRAAELDRKRSFPAEQIAAMGELGLMGISVAEEHGGAGLDKLAYAIAVEEISRGCAGTGAILSVHSLYCHAVQKFGTDEQKEHFLRPFAQGRKIGCFSLSEPQSGSDAAALRTFARQEGDEWVINGSKAWVTNAHEGGAVLVFATTDLAARHDAMGGFLVPLPHPGVTLGRVEDTMGIRCSSHSVVHFDECRVPARNLVGKVGEGFKIAMMSLDVGRIGMAAQAVGIAQAAFDESADYAQRRFAFGAPLTKLQTVQLKFAEMAIRIQASRLLVRQAAEKADLGQRVTIDAAMAKVMASETATFTAHQGMQVLGGYGYVSDYPLERHYRDARITEIYEGTSEILRIVIGGRLLYQAENKG